jgi:hypothetical protein
VQQFSYDGITRSLLDVGLAQSYIGWINPRLESVFSIFHNLIEYIWIIQSDLIQNNLHAEELELEGICTTSPYYSTDH